MQSPADSQALRTSSTIRASEDTPLPQPSEVYACEEAYYQLNELLDCLLLLFLRNIAAHDVSTLPTVLTDRYKDISQVIYNGLFFTIETYHLI